MAALSYDKPSALRHFAERKKITYPLLSDPQSAVIRAFHILNESVPKGTPFYGIPHPGMYIVDERGMVRAKYFEADYRDRFTPSTVLAHEFGDTGGWQRTTVQTRHLTLRYSAADTVVRAGNRTMLLVEIELKPGMHVYAPGVEGGYIPIDWTVTAGAASRVRPVEYPASRKLYLATIDETVPVYEGRFRLARDIIIAENTAPGEMKIGGSFRYQACDDKVCYNPQSIPLEWTFQVEPHDRQRVPAELR